MHRFGSDRFKYVMLNLLVVILYILLAKTGLFFALQNPTITIFWPAGGFALALLLLGGLKYLPGICIGAIIAGLLAANHPGVAFMLGIADTIESCFAYWLLTQKLRFNPALESRQDFFNLVLVAGGTASAISACIGPTALLVGQVIPASLYPMIWLRWWMGDVLGIAFIAPLILVWKTRPQKPCSYLQAIEWMALFGLTVLAGQIVFFDWFQDREFVPQGIAWIILLMAWAGLRAGRHNTTALQLIIFIQVLWSASHGVGRYANDMVQSGLVNFWMFGMVLAVGGMALAVMGDESRKMRSRLMTAERYQRALLDNFPFAVWLKDTESRYLTVNKAFVKIFDTPDPDQVSGRSDFDLFPGDLAERYRASDREVLKTRQNKNLEEQVPAGGQQLWFETYKAPVVDGDGWPLGTVGFTRDISRRKQADVLLQESEERLRLALAAGNQGWFDVNVQTGEISVSDEYVRMLGYDPATFHTSLNEWKQSLHPDDRDAVAAAFGECLATGGPNSMEYRRQRANGDWIWIHSIGKISVWDPDGRPLRMIGTHADITARKNTEAALQESEQRWKFALEGAGDGVWEFNFQTGSCNVSWQLREILGFEATSSEFGNPFIDWAERLHPESRTNTLAALQAVKDGKTSLSG